LRSYGFFLEGKPPCCVLLFSLAFF
jgi:hypothetical protein